MQPDRGWSLWRRMTRAKNPTSRHIYPSSQYPLDLQWVLFHLPPGAALGAVLVFEGVRPGQVADVEWCDIDRWGRLLTVGSTVVHLSRTARTALGPRSHAAGPVVTRWDGSPITRRTLARSLKGACEAAGVGPWTLRDLHRKGARHRAAAGTWAYAGLPAQGATWNPPSARTPYRTLGIGLLHEGCGGLYLALGVHRVRPGLSETAEEWVERFRQAGPIEVDRAVEYRAQCYAIAAGLSSRPTTRVWTETLIHLAAMWAIDDILTEDQAEVFATLVQDNSPLDRAADLARLLADDHD